MPAQGELRGPKVTVQTEGHDAEDQYWGGDASVDAAEHNGRTIFDHTVASRLYRRELAARNWHEVWIEDEKGKWGLVGYKHATKGFMLPILVAAPFFNPRPGFLPSLMKESA